MSEPNFLDRAIGWLSPQAGLKRLAYRSALNSVTGLGYEGGRRTRLRNTSRDGRGPDRMISESAVNVRNHVRSQERNFDLVRGTLRVFRRRVVGASGIMVEPMPRKRDGKVDNLLADQIMRLQRQWARAPEVTGLMTWPQAQRLALNSWLRDGDEFTQLLLGFVPGLTHGSPVPFSLELLESDLVPMDYEDVGNNIRQGIKRNAWGRPISFMVYKSHPQDGWGYPTASNLKEVPADRMLHLALRDRLHQLRGISQFVAVSNVAEDIKDTFEYEMIASKLAASLAVVITRDPTADAPITIPGDTTSTKSAQGRSLFGVEAGLVYDGAQQGEKVEVVDSKRPNAQLDPFMQAVIRRFASGVDAGYSSISRNYNGSYSSQRQELIESEESYKVIRSEFVSMFVMPVYESMIRAAIAAGLLELPSDIDEKSIFEADFRGPAMPWIDPEREANARRISVRAGFTSRTAVIREAGGSPWEVNEQLQEERADEKEKDLVLDSNPANDKPAAAATASAAQPAKDTNNEA